jgi:TolB protein
MSYKGKIGMSNTHFICPRRLYRIAAVIVLLAMLSVLIPDRRIGAKNLSGAISPVWSPDSKKIAYSVFDQDHQNLYMMDLERRTAELLAKQAGEPVWSPDGSKIAYVSFGSDTSAIAIVDVDSKVSKTLTIGYAPQWSANGQQIAYLVAGVLHMANADGTTPRPVLSDPMVSIWDFEWSPDGKHIAFTSQGTSENTTALTIMNPDGSEPNKIADGTYNLSMSWSPDSQQLAFVGFCNQKSADYICMINKDGTSPRALFPYLGYQPVHPTWSPDGQQILYAFGGRICLSLADGSNRHYLTEVQGYSNDIEPVWSPNGKYILFVRMELPRQMGSEHYNLHSEIYVMNADDSQVYNLTELLETI